MNNLTITVALVAIAGVAVIIWQLARRGIFRTFIENFDEFMRSKAAIIITIGLVLNSYLAQLFLNSGGLILPNAAIAHVYLVFAAFGSTTAMSLFEVMLVRLITEMMQRADNGKGVQYGWAKWTIRTVALVIIALYNMYSLALLNYNIWPTGGAPHQAGLVGPLSIGAVDWFHAAIYSTILMLAGTIGEQSPSSEEEASRMKDDILKDTLKDAREEARLKTPGTAMTMLMALAPKETARFFGNYANIRLGIVSREDVLASKSVDGVIQPGAAKKGAAAQKKEEEEEEGDGRAVNEWTLEDVINAGYTIDAPRTLEESLPITQMSQALGLARNKLTNLFKEFEMTPAGEGGVERSKPVTWWQVCALVEFKLIAMPDFIHKATVEAEA